MLRGRFYITVFFFMLAALSAMARADFADAIPAPAGDFTGLPGAGTGLGAGGTGLQTFGTMGTGSGLNLNGLSHDQLSQLQQAFASGALGNMGGYGNRAQIDPSQLLGLGGYGTGSNIPTAVQEFAQNTGRNAAELYKRVQEINAATDEATQKKLIQKFKDDLRDWKADASLLTDGRFDDRKLQTQLCVVPLKSGPGNAQGPADPIQAGATEAISAIRRLAGDITGRGAISGTAAGTVGEWISPPRGLANYDNGAISPIRRPGEELPVDLCQDPTPPFGGGFPGNGNQPDPGRGQAKGPGEGTPGTPNDKSGDEPAGGGAPAGGGGGGPKGKVPELKPVDIAQLKDTPEFKTPGPADSSCPLCKQIAGTRSELDITQSREKTLLSMAGDANNFNERVSKIPPLQMPPPRGKAPKGPSTLDSLAGAANVGKGRNSFGNALKSVNPKGNDPIL